MSNFISCIQTGNCRGLPALGRFLDQICSYNTTRFSLSSLENYMTIKVHQIIRSKRKTLALIVQPNGSIIVRAPLRTSEDAIREFVEKNRQWIEKNQAKARSTHTSAPKNICRVRRSCIWERLIRWRL
jgi:hypothetical protein